MRYIDLLESGVIDGAPSTGQHFTISFDGAFRSRARRLLDAAMVHENCGRPRELVPFQFFALTYLTALAHRPLHITEIYSTYCGLVPYQRQQLDLTHLKYTQLTHFLSRVATLVDKGRLDIVELMNGIFDAHLPHASTFSLAVDSTDYETWARIRSFWSGGADPAPSTHDEDEASPATTRPTHRTWPILREDARLQRTKDNDARDGHRSARNNRPSGPFVGYDLTLAVNIRHFDSAETETVPNHIVGANLTPAGTHHARAALKIVDTVRSAGHVIADIVADRAYNLAKPQFWTLALREYGIEPVFDLTKKQRRPKPGYKAGTILINGTLFTQALPKSFRDLRAHNRDMSRADHAELAQRYDERYLRYGYKPMTTGREVRFRGPVRADRAKSPIRCPNTPFSMRGPMDLPTTNCTDSCSCRGTCTIPDTYEPNVRQRHPYGTTAWLSDYYHRNAVETANSQLRNAQPLERGYTRVFGRIKTAFLLGFTIFAHNQSCIVNHFHKTGHDVPQAYAITHRPLDRPREAPRKAGRAEPPSG
ncbi:hypothetical protein [Gordonia malaquae]|uniref:hypothetical protein n=1 Tax=Gordonia malaquae TaxID=410332 RepID=UPI0030FE4BDF